MKKPVRHLTAGEFFDRLTILVRKAHFDPETYESQLREYVEEIGEDGELLFLLCRLMMANTDVWHLESDIRKGKEHELGLAEVGQRAIAIRSHNNIRIDCINKICSIFGEDSNEKKLDHAGAE